MSLLVLQADHGCAAPLDSTPATEVAPLARPLPLLAARREGWGLPLYRRGHQRNEPIRWIARLPAVKRWRTLVQKRLRSFFEVLTAAGTTEDAGLDVQALKSRNIGRGLCCFQAGI